MPIKLTQEEFINKAILIHNNEYDYSLVNYVNTNIKIEIICSTHGIFLQSPNNHLKKQGCPICRYNKTSKKLSFSNEQFINKAQKIHNNKYNYFKVNYINNNTKITITCTEHGDFLQRPIKHLAGQGCPLCNKRIGYSKFEFINFCTNKSKLKFCDPKVYIIRCYNKTENFIKIGITTNLMYRRFCKPEFPYNYEVLKEIKGSPKFIWNKEKELHKLFKKYKYIPKINFAGKTECFLIDILSKFNF